MKRYIPGVLVLASAAVAGCSDSNLAPVSGRVTLDGKPLAGATVNFQPDVPGKAYPGLGSMAVTGDDGAYTLAVVGQKTNGAVIGPHKVYISKAVAATAGQNPDEERPTTEKVPSRYNGKSTLSFEVPSAGTQAADFDLSSH
jgi:hypothetical protein